MFHRGSASAAPPLSAAPESHWLERKAEAERALNIFLFHTRWNRQPVCTAWQWDWCLQFENSSCSAAVTWAFYGHVSLMESTKRALQHPSELKRNWPYGRIWCTHRHCRDSDIDHQGKCDDDQKLCLKGCKQVLLSLKSYFFHSSESVLNCCLPWS